MSWKLPVASSRHTAGSAGSVKLSMRKRSLRAPSASVSLSSALREVMRSGGRRHR
jgi:hypothetical protein